MRRSTDCTPALFCERHWSARVPEIVRPQWESRHFAVPQSLTVPRSHVQRTSVSHWRSLFLVHSTVSRSQRLVSLGWRSVHCYFRQRERAGRETTSWTLRHGHLSCARALTHAVWFLVRMLFDYNSHPRYTPLPSPRALSLHPQSTHFPALVVLGGIDCSLWFCQPTDQFRDHFLMCLPRGH